MLAARTASRLLALITVFAAAAGLGDALFGRMQLTVTIGAIVSIVVDLGFNNLYVREAARHPDQLERYLRNVLSSRLLLGVVALAVLAAALAVYRLDDLLPPAFATLLLSAYANVLRSTFYATARLGYEAVAILLEAAVLLTLTLAGVRAHAGVAWYLWAYAASYAVSCAYFAVVISVRRIARLGWQLEPRFFVDWLKLSLPFAATFFLTTIYFKSDQPILKLFRSFDEVGWYAFAYKPFEALLFIPGTMLNVVFPVLGVYHRQSRERFLLAVARFYKGLMALGWPASVGIVLLAPGINGLFDRSHRFGPAAAALAVLGAGVFLMFVTTAFVGALNASDRQHLFMWAAAATLAANVVLNFALIPRFGYLGAAWATNLTEAVLLAAGWWLVARELAPLPLHRLSWRIVLAGLVMAVPLWFFRGWTGWPVLIAILIGSLVYAVTVLALRAFDPEELAMLRRLLAPRRA
jgi:O-antigen/teichoic acid export membrane protein